MKKLIKLTLDECKFQDGGYKWSNTETKPLGLSDDKGNIEEINKSNINEIYDRIYYDPKTLEPKPKVLPNNKENGGLIRLELDSFPEGGKIKTTDVRKINPITKQPLKDTQKKSHLDIDPNLVEQLVKGSVERGINPNTTLAIALQETGLGTISGVVGKINPAHENPLRYFGNPTEYAKDPINYKNNYINISLDGLKEKYALANKLNKTEDADSIQAWNGYGKVYTYNNKGMYGIPYEQMETLQKPDYDLNAEGTGIIYNGKYTPTKGIDMNSTPIYGQQVVSLRDSVIMQSPQIQEIVNKYYNPNANSLEGSNINRVHRNIPQENGGMIKLTL